MDHDELARLRAEADQAVEGARQAARSIAAMYQEFCTQGLSTAEALHLTAAWIRSINGSPDE